MNDFFISIWLKAIYAGDVRLIEDMDWDLAFNKLLVVFSTVFVELLNIMRWLVDLTNKTSNPPNCKNNNDLKMTRTSKTYMFFNS
jgi:hypothetical protein